MEQNVQRPPLIDEPLDQELLRFLPEVREPSRNDWRRRIDRAGGVGVAVPVGEQDPSKDLVVLVPGKGMDFRDMQSLSQLQDTYQVVILISDHDQPWDHGGQHIARALEQFVAYRRELGKAQGIEPTRTLRLIGHSAGTLTSQAMLYDLVQRGLISSDGNGLFTKVRYWALDGPWRGVDFPWIVQVFGLKFLARLVTLPPFRLTRGVQSVINRLGPLMNIVTEDLGLPKSVLSTTHVFATGMQDTDPTFRHFEPVSSILWEELAQDEGEHLYEFLKSHETLEEMRQHRNDLDSFSPTRLSRRKGLQNLAMVMIRDHPEMIMDLRELALSSTLDEFGQNFNDVVKRHIKTYEGQHTQFMWTDPQFMIDMRQQLAEF